jgi:hypothetical protein
MIAHRNHYKLTQTHKKQMNKNAYEIRLELLALAHSDVNQIYYEKVNVLREQDQRAMEDYYKKMDVDRLTPLPKIVFNAEAIEALVPSTEAIIKRAEELYRFIEG